MAIALGPHSHLGKAGLEMLGNVDEKRGCGGEAATGLGPAAISARGRLCSRLALGLSGLGLWHRGALSPTCPGGRDLTGESTSWTPGRPES